MQARQHQVHQQKLLTAAKASDLLLQRDRMLRAFSGEVAEEEAPVAEVEVDVLEPETHWQDPSEWDQDTRKQWDDFMRKSKALKVRSCPYLIYPRSSVTNIRCMPTFPAKGKIFGRSTSAVTLHGKKTEFCNQYLSWKALLFASYVVRAHCVLTEPAILSLGSRLFLRFVYL